MILKMAVKRVFVNDRLSNWEQKDFQIKSAGVAENTCAVEIHFFLVFESFKWTLLINAEIENC